MILNYSLAYISRYNFFVSKGIYSIEKLTFTERKKWLENSQRNQKEYHSSRISRKAFHETFYKSFLFPFRFPSFLFDFFDI